MSVVISQGLRSRWLVTQGYGQGPLPESPQPRTLVAISHEATQVEVSHVRATVAVAHERTAVDLQ